MALEVEDDIETLLPRPLDRPILWRSGAIAFTMLCACSLSIWYASMPPGPRDVRSSLDGDAKMKRNEVKDLDKITGYYGFLRPDHSKPKDLRPDHNKPKDTTMQATIQVERVGGCTVTVFQHGWFGGKALALGTGSYGVDFLKGHGLNEHISSVKVSAGCKATLFEHLQFSGHSGIFPEGDYDHAKFLKTFPNDHASSIKVERVACTVTVFQHGWFNGTALALNTGSYGKDFLKGHGLSEHISSVKVSEGCKVTLFKHHQFVGDSGTFPEGDYDHAKFLKTFPNDHASSIKVERVGGCTVTVFKHGSFNGKAVALDTGSYGVDFLKGHGLHDKLTSLKVSAGCKATLFRNLPEFSGDSATFSEGDYDHAKFLKMFPNDHASSIQVEHVHLLACQQQGGCVTVFQNGGFDGEGLVLDTGTYGKDFFRFLGSFRVSTGCKATLFRLFQGNIVFSEGDYNYRKLRKMFISPSDVRYIKVECT